MERKLAIVGLGYVGLPLALTYALDGFQVSGVDIDPRRIESIKSSSLGMREDFDGVPVNDVLRTCLANGSLNAPAGSTNSQRTWRPSLLRLASLSTMHGLWT